MELTNIVVHSASPSEKLNTLLKTIFPTNKFIMHDLDREEFVSKSWYNTLKFLVVDCNGVTTFDKCIKDIIIEMIKQGKQVVLISEIFEIESLNECQFENLKIERPDENIAVVATADKINLILYKNLNALLDKYDVILKLWDLSQCSVDEVLSHHSDVHALSETKKGNMEYLRSLKLEDSKGEPCSLFQYSSLDLVSHVPVDKNIDITTDYILFTSLSKTKDKLVEISLFQREDYFASLNTQDLGKVVLFAEVLASSYTLMERLVQLGNYHPIVIISKEQTRGRGTGLNKWTSPLGCAMFTFLLPIPVNSTLGNLTTVIQQIIAVSIVESVNSSCGIDENSLKIKWPNDIHWDKHGKISGILVKGVVQSDSMYCVIGCGINVFNKEPTVCLYDIIEEENKESGKSLKYPSIETIIGNVLTRIESDISAIQTEPNGIENFKNKYYKYWMHKDQKVSCKRTNGNVDHGTVVGIDNFGFLQVVLADNSVATFHPDVNSFDLVHNMVIPN